MAATGFIVLYVDDEESDRLLMQRAFAKENLHQALHTVEDGARALDYLAGSGTFTDRVTHPLPTVVLLDLNLPEIHGFEVLRWIRGHPVHNNLPVVIFTSSTREEDALRARELGATDFLQKPNSSSRLRQVARHLTRLIQRPV